MGHNTCKSMGRVSCVVRVWASVIDTGTTLGQCLVTRIAGTAAQQTKDIGPTLVYCRPNSKPTLNQHNINLTLDGWKITSEHEMLTQRWFIVGPTSQVCWNDSRATRCDLTFRHIGKMLGQVEDDNQHCTNIGGTFVFAGLARISD